MPPIDAEHDPERSRPVPAQPAEGPVARLLRSFEEESADGDVPFPLFADDDVPRRPEGNLGPVDERFEHLVADPIGHPHPIDVNHPVLYLVDAEGGLS